MYTVSASSLPPAYMVGAGVTLPTDRQTKESPALLPRLDYIPKEPQIHNVLES